MGTVSIDLSLPVGEFISSLGVDPLVGASVFGSELSVPSVSSEELEAAWAVFLGEYDPWKVALKRASEVTGKWRAQQENTEVTFKHTERTWDAGLKSQSRIEPLLKLDALPEGFFWTDHDNNDVPVTMDELRAIAVAMNLAIVERGFAIHQRQREMKLQLESMTAEELLAFEPGWPE